MKIVGTHPAVFVRDLMRLWRTTWDENGVQGSIEKTGQYV
jgi:hypothetical protein